MKAYLPLVVAGAVMSIKASPRSRARLIRARTGRCVGFSPRPPSILSR